MTHPPSAAVSSGRQPSVTARGLVLALLFSSFTIAAIATYVSTALVTIQPIGAIPDGVTLWVWRTDAIEFVDSPDAICERRFGGVSPLCRLGAMVALRDRIIARLPYSETLYLWSTGGRTYRPAALPSQEATDSSSP